MVNQHSISGSRHPVVWYLLPTLLYAAVIIGLSSIPDLHGPELPIIPFDKMAHALEYAGFAILMNRSASYYLRKYPSRLQYLLAWGTVAVFGALDELYQSFVPGRTPDPVDFLVDVCGGGLAILAIVLWWHRGNARQTLK